MRREPKLELRNTCEIAVVIIDAVSALSEVLRAAQPTKYLLFRPLLFCILSI